MQSLIKLGHEGPEDASIVRITRTKSKINNTFLKLSKNRKNIIDESFNLNPLPKITGNGTGWWN